MKLELLGLPAFLLVFPTHFAPRGPGEAAGVESPDPVEQEEMVEVPVESSWQDGISSDIQRSEYFFSTADQGAWSAPNRSQGLRSRIDAEGICVVARESSAGDADAAWEFNLATRAFGREGQMTPVGEPTLEVFEGRVELHRAAFTEWYVNDERGIEQGWTIPSPPPGPLGSGLRIELEASGLQARVAADGLSALFVDDAAEVRLRYHGLLAWDATGFELPARLVRTARGLAVHVDDELALYPIIVDPVLGGPAWTAGGGQDQAWFGASVSGAGDVNGDGFDDVLVGAMGFDHGELNEGRAFLYLGSAGGPSLTPNWTVESDQAGAGLGGTVSGAGDVNGDGFDDVIVTAPGFDNGQFILGRVFLYLGSANGPSLAPDWAAANDQAYPSGFGGSISGAGDVNGDGFDDVIIGAHWFDNGEWREGRVFMYLGSASGLSLAPDWIAESNQVDASFGRSVSGAGDVNGDGFDDMIVGAHRFSNDEEQEGRVFLYLGSASGPSLAPDWTAESDQVGTSFGISISGAGDVNGDGFDDVIVGAPYFTHTGLNEGRAFLYLGSASGPSLTPDWMVEGDHDNVFFGSKVSGAGDVNGDGLDDMIVTAPGFTGGEYREGRALVYLGSMSGPSLAPDWTVESNQANLHLGLSVSGAGDVNGDSFDDVIVGTPYFGMNEGRVFLFLAHGPHDCNGNGIDDRQDITSGTSPDCNANWVPDECDISTGNSSDHDGDGIPDECSGPGTNFCFGDGSGMACPCSNTGGLREGCANSTGQGAALLSTGTASISADDLGLHAYHLPPGQPALLFAGLNALNGGNGVPFGDGLRCAGGAILRRGFSVPNASGETTWGPGLIADTGWAVGETRNFQGWYRDPNGSPCGSNFNYTNGVSVVVVP